MISPIRLISEAAELAARRHNGMARKGRGNEPYINHLAEVASLLATATDGADAELVAAGWLHDTIEDSETTHGELAQRFGLRVAGLVEECTDDMKLSKGERRQKQIEDAPKKSPGAKLIKIADKISNIRARIFANPSREQREELAQKFSDRVASLVAECTDDMSLPKAERRRRQVAAAPKESAGAKMIKIADKISNIRARAVPNPSQEQRGDLADYLDFSEKVVAGCRGTNAALDRFFDETAALARSTL